MTQTITTYDRYAEQYSAVTASGPDWLKHLRQKGFDNFTRLGFPTARRGNEAWKYTNVAPVARAELSAPSSIPAPPAESIQGAVPWADEWDTQVFVNGQPLPHPLQLSTSRDGVTIANLSSVVESDGAVAQQHLGTLASVEDDGFAALNTAFISDGALVHVARGRAGRTPHSPGVRIDGRGWFRRSPTGAGRSRTGVRVHHHRELRRPRRQYLPEQWRRPRSSWKKERRSSHHRLMDESDSSYHVGVARIHQLDGSRFSSRAFYKGVGLGRHDLYVLIGDGCETDLSGLYITSGRQHVDNFINIDHTLGRIRRATFTTRESSQGVRGLCSAGRCSCGRVR